MPSILSTTAWPLRRHICLTCRALVPPWPTCSCGSDEIVELMQDGGRQALVDRVWGPLERRDPVNRPAAALFVVGGLTFAFSMLAQHFGGVMVGTCSVAVGSLFRLVQFGRAEEDRRERGWALPARALARALPAAAPFAGAIRAPAVSLAPMSLRYCVAYAVELRDADADDVFLRDSVTVGFEIHANDGRVVEVPAGPIQIEACTARPIMLDEQIRAYLSARDPSWHPDRYDPFPYATAFEGVVCDGDMIEIYNDLEPVHDPGTLASYREAASRRLRISGTPRIRMLGARTHASPEPGWLGAR